jgi:tetratricopeptide (TPR) repeat protein
MALLYRKEGNLDLAEEFYMKGLKYSPHNFEFFFNLGLLYLEEGKLDSAEEHFEKSLELNPNNPAAIRIWQLFMIVKAIQKQ